MAEVKKMCTCCYEVYYFRNSDDVKLEYCTKSHCPGKLVPMDTDIVEFISLLNRTLKKYDNQIRTEYCCSGHYDDIVFSEESGKVQYDSFYSSPYVLFRGLPKCKDSQYKLVVNIFNKAWARMSERARNLLKIEYTDNSENIRVGIIDNEDVNIVNVFKNKYSDKMSYLEFTIWLNAEFKLLLVYFIEEVHKHYK